MTHPRRSITARFYRALLELLPAEMRDRDGAEIEALFVEEAGGCSADLSGAPLRWSSIPMTPIFSTSRELLADIQKVIRL